MITGQPGWEQGGRDVATKVEMSRHSGKFEARATDEVCGNYTLLKRESAAPKYQGIIIVVHYKSEARSSAHDDSLSVF